MLLLCVQVPPNNILLTPVQCKSLWRQFKSETEYTVTQAISAQVILKIYLRIYVCYKHHLVNGMFSFLFFRRLTSEITTGFHRLGRSCWWLSLVSMNSWCFWSNIIFLALFYYSFKDSPQVFQLFRFTGMFDIIGTGILCTFWVSSWRFYSPKPYGCSLTFRGNFNMAQ